MSPLITITSIIMVFVSTFYFYVSIKEKHPGLFIGCMAWTAGAFCVYQFENLWFVLPAFLIALFTNLNPEH